METLGSTMHPILLVYVMTILTVFENTLIETSVGGISTVDFSGSSWCCCFPSPLPSTLNEGIVKFNVLIGLLAC